jgi:GTPase SAR1 family protein
MTNVEQPRRTGDPAPIPWPGPRQQQSKNNFKVVFLGKSGVGKTSVTLRFCRGTFQDGTEATIGFVIHFHRSSI